MANSTDQAAQSKFELDWNTRDEIISNLDEHTVLLSSGTIKADAKEAMRKANCDLVAALMSLPVKADDRPTIVQLLGHSSDRSNEVLFELDSEVQSRIMDTLMANLDMLEADSVTRKLRSDLSRKNNDLAWELLRLRAHSTIHIGKIKEMFENHKSELSDLRTTLEAEKAKALASLRKKLEAKHAKSIEEAKRKSWCVQCLKEASYFCCRLASYCSNECQSQHWATHMANCLQNKTPVTTTNESEEPKYVIQRQPSSLEEINKLFSDVELSTKQTAAVNQKPREDAGQGRKSEAKRVRFKPDEVCTNQQQIVVQSRAPSPLLKHLNWTESEQTEGLYMAFMSRRKNQKGNTQVNGFMKLAGLLSKPMQRSTNYVTEYVVLRGSASVVIDNKAPMILRKMDAFVVNENSLYSIDNLNKAELFLYFNLSYLTEDAEDLEDAEVNSTDGRFD